MCGLFHSVAGDGSVAVIDPVCIAAKSAEKSKRKRERRLFLGCCKAVFFAEIFEYIVGYGSAVTELSEKCVGVKQHIAVRRLCRGFADREGDELHYELEIIGILRVNSPAALVGEIGRCQRLVESRIAAVRNLESVCRRHSLNTVFAVNRSVRQLSQSVRDELELAVKRARFLDAYGFGRNVLADFFGINGVRPVPCVLLKIVLHKGDIFFAVALANFGELIRVDMLDFLRLVFYFAVGHFEQLVFRGEVTEARH